MSCALVTYVYPEAVKYFPGLVKSIKAQTYRDFDFVIFGDKITAHELPCKGMQYIFIPISGSITEIRIKSLAILNSMNYSKFVFTDADDTLSFNRMELSIKLLETYCLICNDLNIIDKSGSIKEENIWENRLYDGFEFNIEFLIDKNIVGFGNTAIRSELLNFRINFPSFNILASDWYVFYIMLRQSGKTAYFSTCFQTNYRQHEYNIVGVRSLSNERLKFLLDVKSRHYQALLEENCNEVFKEKIRTKKLLNDDLYQFKWDKIPSHMFWWEETNYLIPS
ncbi:MAG: hypothetical protein JXB49_14720 [Bacteroidales bacterium]|nr:hypothetical protein [Bacteroidales bacterium]